MSREHTSERKSSWGGYPFNLRRVESKIVSRGFMMKIRNALIFSALLAGLTQAAVLNDWSFEGEFAGRTLSQASNIGPSVFTTDTDAVTQTDGLTPGGLVCANEVVGYQSYWTDGLVLTADVSDSSGGARYFRYDFDYDMTSPVNDSGTLLGLAFSDGTQTNLAGVALKYDLGDTLLPPPGIIETNLTDELDLTGSISVIAKVDLDTQSMDVWYDLTGTNVFTLSASNAPNHSISNLNLTAISNLQFQATGDLVAPTSGVDCVVVDNIRTATTWEDIIDPLADYSKPAELSVMQLESELGIGVPLDTPNTMTVVVKNNVAPASDISSVLSFIGNPGDILISSSNNVAVLSLLPGQTVTNTYTVAGYAEGVFPLVAQGTIGGVTNGATNVFNLGVGRLINYEKSVVSNDPEGYLPKVVEPGESFDLMVYSKNIGGLPVSNIVNQLIADVTYFPSNTAISATNYAEIAVGKSDSTKYHLVCSPDTPNGYYSFTVINSIADKAWTNQFDLRVWHDAIPFVSAKSVEIHVAPGEQAIASLTLANKGNRGAGYTVTDDGNRPKSYSMERVNFGLYDGFMTSSKLTQWTADEDVTVTVDNTSYTWSEKISESIPLGFDFRMFGGSTVYTNFAVRQHGAIVLQAGSKFDEIRPFASATDIDLDSIHYQKGNGYVLFAWAHKDTDPDTQEFQALIKADGTIQFMYERGTYERGDIRIENQASSFILDEFTPGTISRDAIKLIPHHMVTYTPHDGYLGAFNESIPLTFSVDVPEEQAPATHKFNVSVNWENEIDPVISKIPVTLIIEEQTFSLGTPTNDVMFSGPAGEITYDAGFTVTNIGTAELQYTITDRGSASTGYVSRAVASAQWDDMPGLNARQLSTADLDVESVDIGFTFEYFGLPYTEVVVGRDGILTFADGVVIRVFSDGLTMDNNSKVFVSSNVDHTTFRVTWENMRQANGGVDQTFQAILRRDDGTIQFNYRELTGAWVEAVAELSGDSATTNGFLTNSVSLINLDNIRFVAVPLYETNSVMDWNETEPHDEVVAQTGTLYRVGYIDPMPAQSIEIIPAHDRIITYTPVSGTIPVDGTADIRLIGDARQMNEGDVAQTTLHFVPTEGVATNVTVIFTATGPSAGGDEIETATMWGTSDKANVSWTQYPNGAHGLSWPAATMDGLHRTYTIWFTTSLTRGWEQIASLKDQTSYIDDNVERNVAPVIYYKVTVQ